VKDQQSLPDQFFLAADQAKTQIYPPPRDNPFRKTCTDYCSRRTRLGRRLGNKDERILSRATWSGMRQGGASDVRCDTGVTDCHWPTLEKNNQHFS